jgi:hypothetical protein
MIQMAPIKKKKKKFYSINTQTDPQNYPKIYLVYTFDDVERKIVSDEPYEDPLIAKEAMERYLSQGLCAWIATYNE